MSIETQDFLYQLLPAFYRQQDQQQGEVLRALMAIFESEFNLIKSDIAKTYEDYFVETCELNALPLIGSLLGITSLTDVSEISSSQRRRVANSIRNRRRKGLQNIIEESAQDRTGWTAKLVEYFKFIGITQNVRRLRSQQGTTTLVRNLQSMEAINTPFDINARTLEFRNPNYRQNKYNVPNTGLFVWRFKSYPVIDGYAKKFSDRKYTFDPLGRDVTLFSKSGTLSKFMPQGKETALPLPITIETLNANLEQYPNMAEDFHRRYYGPDASINIVKVLTNGSRQNVLAQNIKAASLSGWVLPDGHDQNIVFIDPVLGRIALPPSSVGTVTGLEVNYYYGSSSEVGGGSYPHTMEIFQSKPDTYAVAVGKNLATTLPDIDDVCTSLTEAINKWIAGATTPASRQNCIIQIYDNATYENDFIVVKNVSNKKSLVIQAINGKQPVLSNNLVFENINQEQAMSINLNGLILNDYVQVSGNLRLTVQYCTLIPRATPSIVYEYATEEGLESILEARQLEVIIENSISGRIDVPVEAMRLVIRDSIIDAFGEAAIGKHQDENSSSTPAPRLQLERSTVFGSIYTAEFELLSESIVTAPVIVNDLQNGVVRYSYLPLESRTPPHFRCQPETQLLQQAQQDFILERFKPLFIETTFGKPNYAQLSDQCSMGIRAGAENGSEMGVYQKQNRIQKEAYLKDLINEYLPNGNEAFIEYVDFFFEPPNGPIPNMSFRTTTDGDRRITQESEERILVY